VVALANLPLLHSSWTSWRVERSGTDVVATVVETGRLGEPDDPTRRVSYRLPASADAEESMFSAEVDEHTFRRAEADAEIGLRMLDGRPSTARPVGEVRSRVGLIGTLGVDALLALVVLLVWRMRGRTEPEVVVVEALGDVELARPGTSWEVLGPEEVRVSGEVLERDEHEVVLDLGDRLVRVVLDGHANPVGYQQPARVRARPAPPG